MNFRYKALNIKGEQITGVISSTSEVQAIQSLRSQGLYPTEIKKTQSVPSYAAEEDKKPKKTLAKLVVFAISFLVGVLVGAILITL